MSVWTPTAIANEPDRDRAHSSCRTAVVNRSAPAPPYFSSYSTPRKPSSPMRGQIAFGMRPAASHASTCGITSRSTKARTVARNISWCSPKTVTRPGSLVAPASLHGVTVHAALGRPRQGLGEHHAARALEASDLRDDEVADLLSGIAVGGPSFHDRLDGFAPLDVGNAVHAHAADAVHLDDHRLHLGGIDVLAPRLDQFLLRLTLDIVEPAVIVEAAHVPRVVPAVAQRVGGHLRLAEVTLEYHRPAHHDLPGRPHGHVTVVVVDQTHPAYRNGLAGGAGPVARALNADESAGLGLAEARPELSLRLCVQALDVRRRVETRDVREARKLAAELRHGVHAAWQDGGHVRDVREAVGVDQPHRFLGVEAGHHDAGTARVQVRHQIAQRRDVEQR